MKTKKTLISNARFLSGLALASAVILAKPAAAHGSDLDLMTFDTIVQGCLQSPDEQTCLAYDAKPSVYLRGNGLPDGSYFFAVVSPGLENGILDGSYGNLSDTLESGALGDSGTGDAQVNRVFHVSNGSIASYTGTHVTGTDVLGQIVIGVAPFDMTQDEAGDYVLAVCPLEAWSASDCHLDGFRVGGIVSEGGTELPQPIVRGTSFYDSNANGQLDAGESTLADWLIDVRTEGVTIGTITTDSAGSFETQLLAGAYAFHQRAAANWIQTTQSQDVTLANGDVVEGLLFGNLCVGGSNGTGGHTSGFWASKSGETAMKSIGMSSALSALEDLNLRVIKGMAFDPAAYAQLRKWLTDGDSKNMAYLLSVQLATAKLNVLAGYVDGAQSVYAPGLGGSGFVTLNDLIAQADLSLAANGTTVTASSIRTEQEALKNALDKSNRNLMYVQPSPANCPAPVFEAI